MSNNHFVNGNRDISSNIFYSLVVSDKWDILFEMFDLKILDINTRDCKGRNALYWAILKNKTEYISKLIDLNISTEVSPNFLAMNFAIYNDNIKVIKCLKNCGLDVNVVDDINSTPLIYAILYNKQNSIQYLIKNGANLDHEDFLGNTASKLLNK